MVLNEAPTYLSSPKHALNSWVTVGGVQTPIYGIETQDNKVSGYIESKEGAVFTVSYHNLQMIKPKTDCTFHIYVDGTKIRGSILRKTSSSFGLPIDSEKRKSTFQGAIISEDEHRPFTFAKPRLTDDDDIACNDETIIRNLGTIQLKVYRGTVVGSSHNHQYRTTEAVTLHEQAKKAALSHQTTLFGAAIPSSEKYHRSSFKYSDRKDSPMLVFEFSYMSRELLELNGHIPDSAPAPKEPDSENIPSIAISDDEEDEEGLDQAEIELARLQAASQVLVDRLTKSGRGRKSEVEEVDLKPDAKRIKLEKGEGSKVKKEEDSRSLGTIVIDDDSD